MTTKYQISIRGDVYKRLVADLKRGQGGRIRPGLVKDRVEQIVSDALDRAEKEQQP